MQRHVHFYEAVPHPYEDVRARLSALSSAAGLVAHAAPDPDGVHGEATLEIPLGAMILGRRMAVHMDDAVDVAGSFPLTRVQVRWEPAADSHAVPTISADLEVEPVDSERTLVSMLGLYEPPLGKVGDAIDRLAMHRVAESALRRVFDRIVEALSSSESINSET